MSICPALYALALLPAGMAQARPMPEPMTAIAPGRWRIVVPGEPARAICVAGAGALIQLRHHDEACARLVIAREKTSVTVHYSCPGTGWGRTTVRVSTPVAVRIATQGIADNAPFEFTAQARRTGDCPSPGADR